MHQLRVATRQQNCSTSRRMTRIPQPGVPATRNLRGGAEPAGAETPEYGHDVPTLLLIESGSRVRDVLTTAHGMLHVEHVTSLKDGLARLARPAARVVLLDLSLPECRDLSAIDEVRRVAPGTAIMMLARAADQALARRAVE